MKWIEKGWYSGAKINFLLLPLSIIFFILYSLRISLFRLGVLKQYRAMAPVIVVGNITVGGTGKTPFVVYLVKLLQSMGLNPGIVSRGYGAKADTNLPFPRLVDAKSAVELVGDEPKLLFERTLVPVVISPNRPQGVNMLTEQLNCNVIISDDGLQHYQMARDIEIVIVDHNRLFGNGWLLPVGPLREPVNRLNKVDLVVHNAGYHNDAEGKFDYSQRAISVVNLKSNRVDTFDQEQPVHLVSGIGNPQRFEQTAKQLNLSVQSTTWFNDHHPFTAQDFNRFNDEDVVVMTEKDAVKCRVFATDNMYYIPIDAQVSPSLESKITQLIQQKCFNKA